MDTNTGSCFILLSIKISPEMIQGFSYGIYKVADEEL